MILLGPAPDLSVPLEAAARPALDIVARDGDGNAAGLVRGSDLRVLLSGDPAPDMPLAATVLLDAHSLDRMEALARYIRASKGTPPDGRLTRQRRRRLKQILQALDGQVTGTAYRAIADSLFGIRRVSSSPWKTSPLRDTTIRLVRDGLGLIKGGYRRLLRRRR